MTPSAIPAGQIVDSVVYFGHVVDKITSKLGTFDKLCVGSTGVTESELDALLDNKNGIAPAAMSAAGEGKSTSGNTTDNNSGNSMQKEQAGTPLPADSRPPMTNLRPTLPAAP